MNRILKRIGLLCLGATLFFNATACKSEKSGTLGESSYLDQYNCLHIDSDSTKWQHYNELVLDNFEKYSKTLRDEVESDSILSSYQCYAVSDGSESFSQGNEVRFCAMPSRLIDGEYTYVKEIKDVVLGAVQGYQFCFVGNTLEELYESFDSTFEEMGTIGDMLKENYEVGKASTLSFAVNKDEIDSENFLAIGESSESEVYFSITVEGTKSQTDNGSEIYVAQIVFQTEGNGLVPYASNKLSPIVNNLKDYSEKVIAPLTEQKFETFDNKTLGEVTKLISNWFKEVFNYTTMISLNVSNFNKSPEDKENTYNCLLEFSNESSLLLEENCPVLDIELSSVNCYLDSIEELKSNANYLDLTNNGETMVLGDAKLIQGYENFMRIVIKNEDYGALQEFSNSLRGELSTNSISNQCLSYNDDNSGNLIIEVFY